MFSPQRKIDSDVENIQNRFMEIPMLKRKSLEELITVRLDKKTADEIRLLKIEGVDCPELIRTFLREKLPEVRKSLLKTS